MLIFVTHDVMNDVIALLLFLLLKITDLNDTITKTLQEHFNYRSKTDT